MIWVSSGYSLAFSKKTHVPNFLVGRGHCMMLKLDVLEKDLRIFSGLGSARNPVKLHSENIGIKD